MSSSVDPIGLGSTKQHSQSAARHGDALDTVHNVNHEPTKPCTQVVNQIGIYESFRREKSFGFLVSLCADERNNHVHILTKAEPRPAMRDSEAAVGWP